MGLICGFLVDSEHAGEGSIYKQSRAGAAFFLNGFPARWRSMNPEATKQPA